jgi:hypothetical protein
VTDEDGTVHTYKYTASADGTFSIKGNNYVQNGLEYYIFFDDRFAYGSTRYKKLGDKTTWDYNHVRFLISNTKKSGITDMEMSYGSTTDKTYVFQLD